MTVFPTRYLQLKTPTQFWRLLHFFIDNKQWGKPFKAVTLNVIPSNSEQTAVICSYPTKHAAAAKRYIWPVTFKKADDQKLRLSHMILERAENFFISPNHVDDWPAKKRKFIEESFFEIVTANTHLKLTNDLIIL